MVEKINSTFLETLAQEIKGIYRSDPSHSPILIEKNLGERLKGFSPIERLNLLENLLRQFEDKDPQMPFGPGLEQEEFSRVFSFLLGRKISTTDLSSAELLEKLAHSLKTIFDTINRTVGVIYSTLLGRRVELETIRQIIVSGLEREKEMDSLQDYLNQIQEAFLLSHQAFTQAARAKVGEILMTLDPDGLKPLRRGWKFGPFRKAELFEIYQERMSKFKEWFESGRFMDELLREFEKNCQKSFKTI
jgi:hypothetical protein